MTSGVVQLGSACNAGAGSDVPVLGERRSEGNAWSESMRRTDVKHGRFSSDEKAPLRAAVEVRAFVRAPLES